jgi:hypothetical protein
MPPSIPSPRTSKTCASCAADLSKDEEIRLHAIRPNDDAVVRICKRCEQEVVPDPEEPVSHRLDRHTYPSSDVAARVKANRALLASEGLCTNGRKHGAALPGKRLCATCEAKWGNEARAQKSKPNTANLKALKTKWRVEGMCLWCGGERAPCSRLCDSCLAKAQRPKASSVNVEHNDGAGTGNGTEAG